MAKKQSASPGLSKPAMVLIVAIVALGMTGIVQATLLNETDVIDPPAVIADDVPGATNDRQQAFHERQGAELPGDVVCNNDIIPAGTVVNSHMIFFNTPGEGISQDLNRVWNFENEVICIMTNFNGLNQASTDSLLGAPGTSYPGRFDGRGLENDDSVTINGTSLTVSMNAEEPGDWIRVLTEVPEPTDTTAPVVYCAPGSNPGGKPPKEDAKNENKFIVLFGEDDSGEAVELFLTDTVSGEEFGPFESDTNLSISVAKGADPLLRETNNQLDYSLRVQGETLLSATDAAGNSTAVTCSS